MNRYLIHYQNGFKRHVSRQELSIHTGLTQIGSMEYRASSPETTHSSPSYLPGAFIFELHGKREKELLQTPNGQIKQLERIGLVSEIERAASLY